MPQGRIATNKAESSRARFLLQPLRVSKMPLDVPPPQFGSPVELSRVHWLKPELVCAVEFLTWTADGLLRAVSYQGLRADKPARDVRRAGVR